MSAGLSYATLRPEPNARVVPAKEHRKRLLEIGALIKEAQHTKKRLIDLLDAGPTKQWLISALDNRLVELTEHATTTATALARAPLEEIAVDESEEHA